MSIMEMVKSYKQTVADVIRENEINRLGCALVYACNLPGRDDTLKEYASHIASRSVEWVQWNDAKRGRK